MGGIAERPAVESGRAGREADPAAAGASAGFALEDEVGEGGGDLVGDAAAGGEAGAETFVAAGRLEVGEDLPASEVRAVFFAVFLGESGFMGCLR